MVAATTHHMGVATVAYARIHTPVRHPHVAPAASAKRSSPIALAGPRLGRAATRRSRKGLTVRAFKEWPQGSVSRSGGEQQQLRVGPSNKVMLAVDDRQEAVEAVAWALHNIVRKGDDVCLVHVVPDPRSAKSDAVANSPTGRPAYSSMDWGDLEVFHQEHRLRVLEAAEQRLRKRFAGCLKYIRDQEALAGRIHLPTVQGPSAAVSIGEALVQVLANVPGINPQFSTWIRNPKIADYDGMWQGLGDAIHYAVLNRNGSLPDCAKYRDAGSWHLHYSEDLHYTVVSSSAADSKLHHVMSIGHRRTSLSKIEGLSGFTLRFRNLITGAQTCAHYRPYVDRATGHLEALTVFGSEYERLNNGTVVVRSLTCSLKGDEVPGCYRVNSRKVKYFGWGKLRCQNGGCALNSPYWKQVDEAHDH